MTYRKVSYFEDANLALKPGCEPPNRNKMSNKNKHKKQPQSVEYKTDAIPDLSLDLIAQKRTGGAVNIRGIRFQTLYSIHTILSNLQPESKAFVQLEGIIEDIDVHTGIASIFIQIKTSLVTIDANRLWELKILQNFYEVFVIDPKSQFLLVHNTSFQKETSMQLRKLTVNTTD